jgi:hypothetical protein
MKVGDKVKIVLWEFLGPMGDEGKTGVIREKLDADDVTFDDEYAVLLDDPGDFKYHDIDVWSFNDEKCILFPGACLQVVE